MEIVSISLSVILPLLLVIAFFTLLERKVMASLQRRIGPNIHGYYGALQPLIDGLKLLWKEMLVPAKANFYIFIFSPMFMMSLSFSLWAILPLSFTFTMFDSKLSLITFFVISSINVYNIILAGWASNSKYAFLGSVRAMGQMFSYELVLGFVLLFMLLTVGSLRIYDIVIKQYYVGYLFWPLLPFAIIFFISLLMETNRAPFDLAEAESELVAGYNVEYSSIMFAMFFLGEYCNILAMSSIWSLLFWGGFIANYFGVGIFIMKILTLCFIFIFVRSMLPRYRIDQLIYVGWHVMLPVALGLCIFIAFLVSVFNIFPKNATYFSATIPENSDLSLVYSQASWRSIYRNEEEFYKNVYRDLIDSIVDEEIEKCYGTEKILNMLATRLHLSEKEFSSYIVARITRMEMGDPRLRVEREELITHLQMLRARFNWIHYFSEWLITPEGRLPYGWSEAQYADFISDGNKQAFFHDAQRNYSTTNLPGSTFISLKILDAMFVNDRFDLPQFIQGNRFLIAPSKYALLSPGAQAKIDYQAPISSVREPARIGWINSYSDALDHEYLSTRSSTYFKSPIETDDIYQTSDVLLDLKRNARSVARITGADELRAFKKIFDLSKLFTKKQMQDHPDVCVSYLKSWRLSAISDTNPKESNGICPLYLGNEDLIFLPFWFVQGCEDLWKHHHND